VPNVNKRNLNDWPKACGLKKGMIIKMKQAYIYNTRLGKIIIAQDEQGITDLSIIDDNMQQQDNEAALRGDFCNYSFEETDLLRETAKQLNDYLEGKQKDFTIKLHPTGTDFQKSVWEALCRIPYGETRSYKQIAEEIGKPKACRAVGMANHNNPIMCIIPCHRVIGSKGELVGYAGGLHIKKYLLDLEKGHVE
jgi:methylated-DNA-[protein]-cysteine S-methyltransferase